MEELKNQNEALRKCLLQRDDLSTELKSKIVELELEISKNKTYSNEEK